MHIWWLASFAYIVIQGIIYIKRKVILAGVLTQLAMGAGSFRMECYTSYLIMSLIVINIHYVVVVRVDYRIGEVVYFKACTVYCILR